MIFFTPMALLGFEPATILSALFLNLLYQFRIHADWSLKLGVLDHVLNTPSAHRVHHARNPEHLDARFGGVLIVFDRLFGTYVAEDDFAGCLTGREAAKAMVPRGKGTMLFTGRDTPPSGVGGGFLAFAAGTHAVPGAGPIDGAQAWAAPGPSRLNLRPWKKSW